MISRFTKLLIIGALASAPITSYAQFLTDIEVRVGAEGKFPIKEKADPNWPYDLYYLIADNGTSGGIHDGIGINLNTVLWHKNWGLSITPTIRYTKLVENIFLSQSDDEYGLTFDMNIEFQYRITSNDWFLTNSALGTGISLANVGNQTETNYAVYEDLNQPPVLEYHVSSFFRVGLSFYWEKHLSKRLLAKFKIIYSDQNMMRDYIPNSLWDINGSISIQYKLWNKKYGKGTN